VAVHVVLDRDQIRSILSLYHLDDLEDFGGIAEGSINTSYWVQVNGRRYFLRITEKKRVDDMIYEKELLLHLDRQGVAVPRLIKNVARGTFTPWASRGRYVSLFEYMPGRELGVFEVRPRHVTKIGRYAGALHTSTKTFVRTRHNEFNLASLDAKMRRIQRALQKKRLAKRFTDDVTALTAEITRQKKRRLDDLPVGTVHGDLFIDNAKFRDDDLVGCIDFEMASTERLVWDVAVTLNDWCWQPTTKQMGGPAGRFHLGRVRAFLEAYDRTRPLTKAERRALPHELRLAAARFAITRIVDFELKRLPASRRVYKDYRHYTARLEALADGGAEALVERIFG
jgi:homoserine kinase type II